VGVTRSRINQATALQVLGLYRQAQNTALKAEALRSLGNVFRVVGELEKSRQVLEQSLAVTDKKCAQKVLLQGKFKHPYFWAAFVLLGNWL
jgi:CHAT domain-containing protein